MIIDPWRFVTRHELGRNGRARIIIVTHHPVDRSQLTAPDSALSSAAAHHVPVAMHQSDSPESSAISTK
jgi:hypothetical protein